MRHSETGMLKTVAHSYPLDHFQFYFVKDGLALDDPSVRPVGCQPRSLSSGSCLAAFRFRPLGSFTAARAFLAFSRLSRCLGSDREALETREARGSESFSERRYFRPRFSGDTRRVGPGSDSPVSEPTDRRPSCRNRLSLDRKTRRRFTSSQPHSVNSQPASSVSSQLEIAQWNSSRRRSRRLLARATKTVLDFTRQAAIRAEATDGAMAVLV